MLANKILLENRKHRRFRIKNELYILNSNSSGFGEVIDISLGGLAFCHIKKQFWPNNFFKVGILFGDNEVLIDELPMKTVSECAVNPGLPDNSTTIWRRSVQFGELSPEQKIRLENIIQRYTI